MFQLASLSPQCAAALPQSLLGQVAAPQESQVLPSFHSYGRGLIIQGAKLLPFCSLNNVFNTYSSVVPVVHVSSF